MAPFSHHSHIALLICAYKPDVSETEKHRFAGKLVGLQELCRRGAGEGGGKYVVSVEAGAEESDGTFSKVRFWLRVLANAMTEVCVGRASSKSSSSDSRQPRTESTSSIASASFAVLLLPFANLPRLLPVSPAHLEVAREFEAANVVSDRLLLCFENGRF